MNRREFAATLGGAAAVALGGRVARADAEAAVDAAGPAAAAAGAGVSARARALYAHALVLDANASPPFPDQLPMPQADLELVRASGINVVKTTLGGINDDFAKAVAEIAGVQRLIEAYPGTFMQVRVPGDMHRARREGRLGIIFSFESADMLGGDLASIGVFRDLGVRVMQLSYNRRSPFAAGVMEPDAGGLTPLGRDAVRTMNRLGVAIDLSHANAATTADVLALTAVPPVMTHASCAAVYAHPRAKTDEQLRALAARGGVVGIFDLPYLAASPHQPDLGDYLAHLEHALAVCGEDHVGIGSDVGIAPFDTSAGGMAEFARELEQRRAAGLSAPGEDRPTYVEGLNHPRRIETIADRLLARGYSDAATAKIIGGNFVRVFTQAWSA